MLVACQIMLLQGMKLMDELLNGKDVAKILNVSLAYAYGLMAQGQIPSVRFGRSVRVRKVDLEAFIENNLSKSGSQLYKSLFIQSK